MGLSEDADDSNTSGDTAYLTIRGYFPTWNQDFQSWNKNEDNETYVNELYRGCKVESDSGK